MRILIFTFGTRGDVQPYIALGKALCDRGHTVALSTGQGFETLIERHGLTAAPVSIDFRELVASPVMQEALHTFSGKIKAWRSFKGQFRRQFNDMWAVAREAQPDLLIAHPKGFAAHEIAEALQIVSLPTCLQPGFVPTSAFPQFLVPFANLGPFGNRLSHSAFDRLAAWGQAKAMGDWRQTALGLRSSDPKRFRDGYRPDGKPIPHLHGYSPLLVSKPGDWGESEYITGDWHLEHDCGWTPPAELSRFLNSGPPPVYVGFGSMPARDAERTTQIVLEALRLSGQRGIAAAGWGGMASVSGSDNIFALDAAPHDWLFPQCSAVVHHGGAGTTHEGLRRGRPTIICPFGVDQPFWGRRVHRLGAGPEPIAQKRLTAPRLAAAIGEALSPEIVSCAAQIGTAMRAERGAETAAEIVETVTHPTP